MSDAAGVPSDSSQPPEVTLQLLDKLGISYREVSDATTLLAVRRVQASLLEDAVGTLLVRSRRANCWT